MSNNRYDGNVALMREALKYIAWESRNAINSKTTGDERANVLATYIMDFRDKADAALAAGPARNVDTVKSLDDFLSEKYQDDADMEMIKEWREDEVAFCLRHPFAGSLLHSLRWLFLPAQKGCKE